MKVVQNVIRMLYGQDTGILLYRQDTGILLYGQDIGILVYCYTVYGQLKSSLLFNFTVPSPQQ